MSTTISAPQGFFIDDAVSPVSVADLGSAVEAAQNALSSVTSAVATTGTNATAAATSATAAAGSANSASTSASAASTSASAASTSASTAATQASGASTSATNAAASATSAANSAASASTNATNAAASATAAGNSATSAATSATNASSSATSASSSASSASTSATTATTQASNAATSATNAAASATSASSSASTAASYAASVVGFNWAPNPRFAVNQRSVTSFSSSGYMVDRWFFTRTGSDTTSVQVQALTDTDRTNIGDESATQSLLATVAGTSGGSSYVGFRIPSVRSTANKPMVLTIYVKGSTTAKFAASYDQVFGTGGSPSATVSANIGVSPTITASFAKYTLTFTPASTSGKTLGTNGDDYTQILLWLSDGTSDARSGGLGVQSSVSVQGWGVKLEEGSSGTALAPEDYEEELAECQRFYATLPSVAVAGYNTAGNPVYLDMTLPVTMWKAPAVTLSGFSDTNAGNATVSSTTADSVLLTTNVTATGFGSSTCTVVCEADL